MSEEGFELEYIHDAFTKNWVAPLGENVNEFEHTVGAYLGSGYPVALSSGTAALHLGMILAGVKAGDKVTQGQVIGVTGSTGVSSGPHLHYEITEKGSRVDPKQYLPGWIKAW